MEFQIKAQIIKGLGNIEPKFVFVNDKNYILVRKRLELERRRAIAILVDMKNNGQIKAVNKPKNLRYKKELNELMVAKGEINKAISKIKEMYYKR